MINKILEKLKWFSVVAAILLINPTGYSYYHFAIKYNWDVSVSTGFMAILGCILVGIVIYYITMSWTTTGKIGKFIFFPIMVAGTFIFYAAGFLNSSDAISWISLAWIILFKLWGMLYSRLAFGTHKTRNVQGEVGLDEE